MACFRVASTLLSVIVTLIMSCNVAVYSRSLQERSSPVCDDESLLGDLAAVTPNVILNIQDCKSSSYN